MQTTPHTRSPSRGAPLALVLLAVAVLAAACSDDEAAPSNTTSTASSGGSGATGGAGGADGGGGSDACLGECGDPTPFCDELLNDCVACLEDTDCTSPTAAKCNAGECVPCDASTQCAGIAGTEVCDTAAGTCVECALNEEAACDAGAGETCDLIAHECVAVGPETVLNCNACTNDAQCTAGHRCIPMDFEGSHHGYYCLEEAMPTCAQPFQVPINKPSISEAAAVDYCGIEEDLATCEAVLALLGGWHCTGTDGKCSQLMGGAEVDVPGSLCRQVGVGANKCTYACDQGAQCLTSSPGNTCGGDPIPNVPPGWCGG